MAALGRRLARLELRACDAVGSGVYQPDVRRIADGCAADLAAGVYDDEPGDASLFPDDTFHRWIRCILRLRRRFDAAERDARQLRLFDPGPAYVLEGWLDGAAVADLCARAADRADAFRRTMEDRIQQERRDREAARDRARDREALLRMIRKLGLPDTASHADILRERDRRQREWEAARLTEKAATTARARRIARLPWPPGFVDAIARGGHAFAAPDGKVHRKFKTKADAKEAAYALAKIELPLPKEGSS
jgi:hypothetical protein